MKSKIECLLASIFLRFWWILDPNLPPKTRLGFQFGSQNAPKIHLGASWRVLGPLEDVLEVSWSVLKASWRGPGGRTDSPEGIPQAPRRAKARAPQEPVATSNSNVTRI